MSTRAHIGLGSNLGERLANLGEALRRLDSVEGVDVRSVSRAYESEPWGVSDQPPFANAVALAETSLRADQLLGALQDIESSMGRTAGPRNSPRTIDLDILLFGDEEWDTPELTIPHPRMAERDFVITPLLVLDSDAAWPDGSAVTREGVRVGRVIGVISAIPGFEPRTVGDDEWIAVYERPGYSPMFAGLAPIAGGVGAVSARLTPGNMPNMATRFIELVLDQLGIPHVWDPFAPEESVDPYNLSRPFRLMVPSSMAEEASRAIREATNAPIEWEDLEP